MFPLALAVAGVACLWAYRGLVQQQVRVHRRRQAFLLLMLRRVVGEYPGIPTGKSQGFTLQRQAQLTRLRRQAFLMVQRWKLRKNRASV